MNQEGRREMVKWMEIWIPNWPWSVLLPLLSFLSTLPFFLVFLEEAELIIVL